MTRIRLSFAWLVVVAAGCSSRAPDAPPPARPAPISGAITLDGKPLGSAVVTFMPQGTLGAEAVGETGADGSYVAATAGKAGVLPGEYRVIVSYLAAPGGKAVGLEPRSKRPMPEELIRSKELLPGRASNPARTTLSATVPPGGGRINYALIGPLAEPPPALPPGSMNRIRPSGLLGPSGR